MHRVVGQKGIIYIRGSLSKYGTAEAQGINSYLSIRQSIAELQGNSKVNQILFYIDSCGGHVDGAFDTADLIFNCAKPTSAFITGVGCSAAYLLASQCNTVHAEQGSIVGSIGVMRVLQDTSENLKQLGIKNIVVASGEKKGRLADGIEINSSDIESIKKDVDYFAAKFAELVKRGRKNITMDQFNKLKDGDAYIAEEAIDYGLIDSLTKYTDFIAGEYKMSEPKIEEIKAELPQEEPKEEKKDEEVIAEEEVEISELDKLKEEIEKLKEIIESMKPKEEAKAEEEPKEEEVVDEKKPEAKAEMTLNQMDLYLIAAKNDKALAFEGIQNNWSMEKVNEISDSRIALKGLKQFDKGQSKDVLMSQLLEVCETEADAKAMLNEILKGNK